MCKIVIWQNNEKGFSLIEILIALFLTGVVIASVFSVYINQHKNWIVQEQITDSQQNARAAIDELTRQIRMAGYGLPLGLNGIEAFDTDPDTIVITYADGDCNAPIEHDMTNPSADLRCDGHDISCFSDGQWVFIFEPDSGGGEFFEITNVQTGSWLIQHNTMNLSKAYTQGAIVMSLFRMKYYIDRTDTLHPNLMMQLPGQTAQVYAENIEDLQFRYTMKNGSSPIYAT
jgi:prepilin-type N-terminal cleavage/methylation domain-containing protein